MDNGPVSESGPPHTPKLCDIPDNTSTSKSSPTEEFFDAEDVDKTKGASLSEKGVEESREEKEDATTVLSTEVAQLELIVSNIESSTSEVQEQLEAAKKDSENVIKNEQEDVVDSIPVIDESIVNKCESSTNQIENNNKTNNETNHQEENLEKTNDEKNHQEENNESVIQVLEDLTVPNPEYQSRLESVSRIDLETNSLISKLESKISILAEENSSLQRKLDDALSEVFVAGCVKESLVELERQNASRIDEVATLQHLLQETSEDASSTRTRFEHECARLQAIIDQLDHENKELKGQIKGEKSAGPSGDSGGGGLLVDRDSLLAITDVTKSFARKVKNNFQQSVMPQSSPSHQPTSPIANNVEESMRKAYEDTELLKSIVVPLEEQIQALKDKLRQTDSLLREHESRQAQVLLKTETLGQWLNGKTTDAAIQEMENKANEVLNQEMYVGLLVSRLALLTTELDARRREQASIIQELDKCRKKVSEFKKQASSSSSQLLNFQQKHITELTALTSILSPEQKSELELKMNSAENVLDEPQQVGEIVVSSETWNNLQKELSHVKSHFGMSLSGGLIDSEEVSKMKSDLKELVKDKEALAESEAKLKEELLKQSVARKEIEQTWNEKSELHKFETQNLSERIIELEGIVQSLSVKYNDFCKDTRQELGRLIQYREKIVTELKRLQNENEKLVGLYDSKSVEMQNEMIDLPSRLEDMQLLLLTYREELIHAKVAKEHFQERLKGEVSFLKTQLKSEQESKVSLEDQLSAEIETLKEKVCLLESCKTELEAEQKRHEEFLNNEIRHRQTQANLRKQVDALEMEKKQTDAKIQEFKARITNLQQELDNSVAVQNDFVRLSQSLQMELEKIRAQATEVRWQHEDDVDECSSCKHYFHGSRRKKGHCRHCGKIFCQDCLSKNVSSGPHQRPARVCDVCHTLLVQHSAPYFSTEAPHVND